MIINGQLVFLVGLMLVGFIIFFGLLCYTHIQHKKKYYRGTLQVRRRKNGIN